MTRETEESDTVLACPHCDRASIQHANRDTYRCQVCKETFDEPVERERRAPSRIRGDSLARVLANADPDDLMTDGGTDMDVTEREKAERFWSRYDIPFEHDTCIKVRRSGLLRGSSGTGHAADTVVHLHVVEPFNAGRLSRTADSYLCENDSFVGFQGREERRSEDGEVFTPTVTCDTCLQRMERWKTSEVDTEVGQGDDA